MLFWSTHPPEGKETSIIAHEFKIERIKSCLKHQPNITMALMLCEDSSNRNELLSEWSTYKTAILS